MTVIECEHIENSIALGEDHDRSVGESNLEAGVTPHDDKSRGNVHSAEGFEPIGTSGDLIKQRSLRPSAHPDGEQVVQLGQYERR